MTQDEFIILCTEGDYTQISDAIHSGIDPNGEGELMGKPITPMFVAVSSGNEDAVKALAENGADCAEGFTAALISQRIGIVRLLVECGADINVLDRSGNNALITSVTMNRPDLLEEIISLGADVNAKAASGYTALTYAAMMASHKEGLREDIHEDTTFNPQLVTLLMENGADYDDAMLIAIRTRNAEFVSLLLAEGADVNTRDDDGRSLVMYSLIEDCEEVLRVLLEHGADPNIPDNRERTPLMIACIDEEIGQAIIDTLLEFGADIDAVDDRGLTALMWAVSNVGGPTKTPDLLMPALIRTGGLRAEGWEKWCAFASLYTAAKHELQIDTVRHLVEKGADVNIVDNRGLNAMMYALANGDDESADILGDAGAQINFDIT